MMGERTVTPPAITAMGKIEFRPRAAHVIIGHRLVDHARPPATEPDRKRAGRFDLNQRHMRVAVKRWPRPMTQSRK
jgi:hypothetical protein